MKETERASEPEPIGEACGAAFQHLAVCNEALDACRVTGKQHLYQVCLGVVVQAGRDYLRAVEAWQAALEA